MKNESTDNNTYELRPEYNFAELKGGVRGKQYERIAAGTNLVLIDPGFSDLFADSEAVNSALRVLADAANSTAKSRTRRTS